MALVMASIPFFTKYVLQIPDSQSTFLFGAVLLIAIAAIGVWAKMIARYSVVPVWRAALLILGLGFIPLYFVSSLTNAVLASAFVGIGFAGVICTMDLIGARIIDEDSAASGVRREAIYSNAIGFMNRLNGLFTSLAFYLVYTFYGFESGENPGPNPAQAVRFLLVLFPVLLIAISYLFSRFLDFEDSEEVPHVRAVSHH